MFGIGVLDNNISWVYIYTIKIKKGGKNIMPRFNGTGPMGQGAETGRGLGPCGGMRRG